MIGGYIRRIEKDDFSLILTIECKVRPAQHQDYIDLRGEEKENTLIANTIADERYKKDHDELYALHIGKIKCSKTMR